MSVLCEHRILDEVKLSYIEMWLGQLCCMKVNARHLRKTYNVSVEKI